MSNGYKLRAGNSGPVFDGNAGDLLELQADGTAKFVAAGSVDDHKVAVTANDTTPNYLSSKLSADVGVTLTLLTPGANENLEIGLSVNPSNAEELDNGNFTGGKSLTLAAGPAQRFTLTGNTTLLVLGLIANRAQWFQLKAIQGGAGSFTLTITGAKTPGGAGLTLSTAIGAQDLISCYWDGTTIYASVAGLAFA